MDHEKWLEQHDQMMADFDQKLAAAREEHDRDMKEIREDHKQLMRDMRVIGRVLRRAIRDGIREARNERVRRQRAVAEIDDQITKLSAAQLITEEKLQQLIERDKQRYGTNGNPPAAQ